MQKQNQVNFFDLELKDIEELIEKFGKHKYRAKQIYKWVYEKGTTDFDEMSNLSKTFRAELPSLICFDLPQIINQLTSVDGTKKFLFQLKDNLTIESVLIPSDDHRLTLCVSSEVGCNLGCRFCYTGLQKLKRRLTVSEILGQYLSVKKSLSPEVRITNIVFMGMGEPLDNPEAVFKAIRIIHSPEGINFSRKKITVSTAGLVDRIPLVSEAKVRLAVSLNGTTDEIRSKLMPINKKYPLHALLESCRQHVIKTKDKVTFEYILIKGLTDSLDDARRLKKISQQVSCKMNIIAFNEHPGTSFQRPDEARVMKFHQALMDLNCHVLLRRTMGGDIYAACGQLTSTDR